MFSMHDFGLAAMLQDVFGDDSDTNVVDLAAYRLARQS